MPLIEQPWNIEIVEWEDACSWSGAAWKLQRDKTELERKGLSSCRTIGFLVCEDDREIKLAQTHQGIGDGHNEGVSEIQCIPKTWIQSRRRLATVAEGPREVVE